MNCSSIIIYSLSAHSQELRHTVDKLQTITTQMQRNASVREKQLRGGGSEYLLVCTSICLYTTQLQHCMKHHVPLLLVLVLIQKLTLMSEFIVFVSE